MVAQLLSRVRHAPDRLLHPVRRRAAHARVAARPRPDLILVVCYGNICRSPFAAAVLRRALPDGIAVESAGFVGPGRAPPGEAVTVAARRGVDLAPHRSRLLLPDLAGAAGLIVVMDAAQERAICARFGRLPRDVVLLGDFDPGPIETRAIRDPVDQPEDAFVEAYARIERCVGALAGTVTRLPAVRTA